MKFAKLTLYFAEAAAMLAVAFTVGCAVDARAPSSSVGDASSGSQAGGDSGLGGDDTGGDAGTGSHSEAGGHVGTGAAGSVTFTEVFAVLEPCSGCHIYQAEGFEKSGQLTFQFQNIAYDELVGVPASGVACGSSSETRVVPGDSAHSLLYQKISESKPPCGTQMRLHAKPLGASDVALIAQWIDEGAPNN